MAKFMEEGNHLSVTQQGWLVGSWLIEICHHSSGWQLNLSIDLSPLLQWECGGMAVFVVSREQIKIELPHNLVCGLVLHLEGLDLLVPSRGAWHRSEFEAKEILVYSECLSDNVLHGEILSNLFCLNLIVLLDE